MTLIIDFKWCVRKIPEDFSLVFLLCSMSVHRSSRGQGGPSSSDQVIQHQPTQTISHANCRKVFIQRDYSEGILGQIFCHFTVIFRLFLSHFSAISRSFLSHFLAIFWSFLNNSRSFLDQFCQFFLRFWANFKWNFFTFGRFKALLHFRFRGSIPDAVSRRAPGQN